VPLFRSSSHCWCVPFFVICGAGRLRASHSCCQAKKNLICHGPLYRLLMLLPDPQCLMPCATFRSPHTAAAARPLNSAMGPYTASSCCCQVQSLSWVPVTALHCCCLPSPHSAHVPLSG
ncbi:unnamed protein product, partial [Staurois parvus]